jgi:kynureninase
VDLCNAVSVAYAIPIAVFDLAHVAGSLQVRHATGDEDYLAERELAALWGARVRSAVLTREAPGFDVAE